MKKQFQRRAFSLIEMSVVLIIVAILMAGIFSGKRMIAQGKLQVAQALTKSSPISSMPDLLLWLETSLDKSVTVESGNAPDNNELVTSWNDISGNKFNVTQATQTNRPSYITSGIGSLPSIKFDGVDNSLSLTNLGLDFGANYTIFIVFNANSYATVSDLMSVTKSGVHGMIIEVSATTGTIRFVHRSPMGNSGGDSNTSTNVVSTGTNYILACVRNFDNSVLNLSLNNSSWISSTTLTSNAFDNTNLNLHIGQLYNDTRFFNGTISEIIMFSRTLNSTEVNSVQQYLSKKYNITLS